jgi:glutamyl-tRNA synthetase
LVKERCTLLNDIYAQSVYFFQAPQAIDVESVKPKWSVDKVNFFTELIGRYEQLNDWNLESLENCFKALATEKNIKVGDVQFIYRIMLVGGKFGPGVFQISEMLGKKDSLERIQRLMSLLG